MSVVDRIEEFSDIDLHDPAAPHRHRLLPEAFQGLVRRPSRAEAVRTVLEVLLVDRFQDHDDRTLKHLILEGRDAQRPGLGRRAGLGDMDPTHRRRLVRAGLGSVQQRPEVALQVRRVVLAALSVHAHRPVLARTPVSLTEPVDVDEVSQGRESHLRALPSEFRYPLLFRGHVHGFRCTRHVSLQRSFETASPSLRGVLRSSSPASSVLWDAPTPCRPSRRTSLPSLGDTTVASLFAPTGRDAQPGAPGSWYSGSRAGNVGGNGRVSQVPERPSCPFALFLDPGRTEARQAIAASRRGPRLCQQRWLPRAKISGLDRTALGLAVYASQWRSPATTQDSLPAAGQALPGGIR